MSTRPNVRINEQYLMIHAMNPDGLVHLRKSEFKALLNPSIRLPRRGVWEKLLPPGNDSSVGVLLTDLDRSQAAFKQ